MKIRRQIRRSGFYFALGFSGFLAGCSGDTKMVSGCQADNQCPGDQICRPSDGKCVAKPEYTMVTIEKFGDGSGTVTSEPAGIDCGNTCSGSFQVGSPLKLTAVPAAGSRVGSFSVGCASGNTTCEFSPENTEPVRVVVNFSLTDSGGPAALCNTFGFCWENPKPVGNRLNDVAVVAPGELWAVGDAGTIVRRSGGVFSLVSTGQVKNLYSIWGSAAELYIVGEGGVIIHGVSNVLTPESSPVTTDLYDVFSTGGIGYAVGAGGRLLRRTSSWAADTSPTSVELRGVYGNSTSDVWAVGAQGTAVRWNGSMWSTTPVTAFGTFTMRGISGGGGGPLYAIDSFGGIYSYNTSWSQVRSMSTDDLQGVSVISGTPYVAGNNVGGMILHYTGTSWTRDVQGSIGFRGVSGTGPTELWAVGEAGAIWQSDGTTWNPRGSGITSNLNGVFATDGQHAWAVGQNGALMVYNGSYFAPFSLGGSTPNLNAVWASSASNVIVVGNNGFIVRYDGSNWLTMTSGTTQNLRAVYGVSATRAYAVGDNGAVVTYDGTSWTPMTGASTNLRAVWASSSSDIYVAGDLGKVLRSTGGAFTEITPGPATTASIGGIFGTTAGDFWITADTSLLRYSGGSFGAAVTPAPAVTGLRGIFGTTSSEIFAVGGGGALVKYNGTSWSRVTTGAGTDLLSVGTSGRKLWLVGSGGTILRQDI